MYKYIVNVWYEKTITKDDPTNVWPGPEPKIVDEGRFQLTLNEIEMTDFIDHLCFYVSPFGYEYSLLREHLSNKNDNSVFEYSTKNEDGDIVRYMLNVTGVFKRIDFTFDEI